MPTRPDAPRDAAPRDAAPQDSAPQSGASPGGVPRCGAPQDSASQSGAPRGSAPRNRAPWEDVPLEDAPEPRARRLERNWSELLQEIRVAQAGVQILFAFLLTLPFTQRWNQVTDFQRALYLATLLLVAAASALLIGPVAYHRIMFRRGARARLVAAANTMALAGLVMLGAGINGAVLLVVDVLMGPLATVLICSATAAFFVALWWALPQLTRWELTAIHEDAQDSRPPAPGAPDAGAPDAGPPHPGPPGAGTR
ncbi:DUF6328 family protein [Candidatus Protofrankia datiscae]|uniref:DUF6328 family protein n=1 Tax=Candidatus Protofrankia datiscae TaxID=2716812 RepID=UPI00215820A6|nr:DUF6328 family protein [Candidatus Protofrankia datiscae]